MWKKISVLMLILVGCERPGPIILQPDTSTDQINVISLVGKQSDSTVVFEHTYDRTGLAPTVEEDYPATILVNGVRSDLGEHRTQYSFSQMVVNDRLTTISVQGRFGRIDLPSPIDVGRATVNHAELERLEAIVQIRSTVLLPIRTGVFYKLLNEGNQVTNPFIYSPSNEYVVNAEGRGPIRPFSLDITSPDDLRILEPRPLSLVLRNADLTLRWQGKVGEVMQIIIGTYDRFTGKPVKPLMLLTARPHSNTLVIPAKVMRMIPESPSGRLMFTVVSANRSEEQIPGYADRVLVQSASINNIAVTVY